MATAQQTCTQIIALARIWAQDNDVSGNFGVATTTAQSILNTLVSNWLHQVMQRPIYVGSATTGLAFNAGDTMKRMTAALNFEEFADVYQQSGTSVSFPLPIPPKRISVREIIDMYGIQPGGTVSSGGSIWTYWAAEKDQVTQTTDQDTWRVFVFPSLQSASNLTIKATRSDTVSGGSDVPDVPYEHDVHLSRLLAAEIQKLNGVSQSSIDANLQMIPGNYLRMLGGEAIAASQLQNGIDWVRD